MNEIAERIETALDMFMFLREFSSDQVLADFFKLHHSKA